MQSVISLDIAGTLIDMHYFDYVWNEGIVHGYEDGTYKPDDLINRAEFAKIIVEAVREDYLMTMPETEGFIICDPANEFFADAIGFPDVPAAVGYHRNAERKEGRTLEETVQACLRQSRSGRHEGKKSAASALAPSANYEVRGTARPDA